LLDGQRKLLSFVASGNAKAQSTNALQPSSGAMGGLPEVSTQNFPHSMTLAFTIYLFYFLKHLRSVFILGLYTLRMVFLFVCQNH
jgi:hypothetical protein